MVDLSYSTEHLCWKQRCSKELIVAQSMLSLGKSKSNGKLSTSFGISNPNYMSGTKLSNARKFLIRPTKGPMEQKSTGRGSMKQASPVKVPIEHSKSGGLLSRPNSALSFNRKRMANAGTQYSRTPTPDMKVAAPRFPVYESPQKQSLEPRVFSRSSSAAAVRRMNFDRPLSTSARKRTVLRADQPYQLQNALDTSVSRQEEHQPIEVEDDTQPQEEFPQEEQQEEASEDEIPVPPRPPTASTWRTSASQKQYIELLESMLKKERRRRVKVEVKYRNERDKTKYI